MNHKVTAEADVVNHKVTEETNRDVANHKVTKEIERDIAVVDGHKFYLAKSFETQTMFADKAAMRNKEASESLAKAHGEMGEVHTKFLALLDPVNKLTEDTVEMP